MLDLISPCNLCVLERESGKLHEGNASSTVKDKSTKLSKYSSQSCYIIDVC